MNDMNNPSVFLIISTVVGVLTSTISIILSIIAWRLKQSWQEALQERKEWHAQLEQLASRLDKAEMRYDNWTKEAVSSKDFMQAIHDLDIKLIKLNHLVPQDLELNLALTMQRVNELINRVEKLERGG